MKMTTTDHLLEYSISDNVTAFTTTREGGCSIGTYSSFNVNRFCGDDITHVKRNQEILCSKLHITSDSLIIPHQTHSTNVMFIDEAFLSLSAEEKQNRIEGIDALVTDRKDIAICVSTADCVPIVIHDTRHHTSAAIHAGWRGTVNRIAEKTIDMMHERFGTEGKDCLAVIGPSISADSFEVGDEVYDAFMNAGFDMKAIARLQPKMHAIAEAEPAESLPMKWHIDLWECNRLQLMSKKTDANNIHVAGICTYKNSDKFFSARKLGINSGRLLTGIILR